MATLKRNFVDYIRDNADGRSQNALLTFVRSNAQKNNVAKNFLTAVFLKEKKNEKLTLANLQKYLTITLSIPELTLEGRFFQTFRDARVPTPSFASLINKFMEYRGTKKQREELENIMADYAKSVLANEGFKIGNVKRDINNVKRIFKDRIKRDPTRDELLELIRTNEQFNRRYNYRVSFDYGQLSNNDPRYIDALVRELERISRGNDIHANINEWVFFDAGDGDTKGFYNIRPADLRVILDGFLRQGWLRDSGLRNPLLFNSLAPEQLQERLYNKIMRMGQEASSNYPRIYHTFIINQALNNVRNIDDYVRIENLPLFTTKRKYCDTQPEQTLVEHFNDINEFIYGNMDNDDRNCVANAIHQLILKANSKKANYPRKLEDYEYLTRWLNYTITEYNKTHLNDDILVCLPSPEQCVVPSLADLDIIIKKEEQAKKRIYDIPDDAEILYDMNKEGLTSNHIEYICNKTGIGLLLVDDDGDAIKFMESKNRLGSIIGYIREKHLYIVNDNQYRKYLSAKNTTNDKLYLKQYKPKSDKKSKDYYLYPYVIIPKDILEHDKIYEFINKPEYVNSIIVFADKKQRLKDFHIYLMSQKNRIFEVEECNSEITEIRFSLTSPDAETIAQPIYLLYNEKFELVKRICAKMSIPFKNQTLPSLALQAFNIYNETNNNNIDKFKSFFNPVTKKYFGNLATRNAQNYNIHKPVCGYKIFSYDENKAYSYIMETLEDIPVIQAHSLPQPFTEEDEIIDHYLYHIKIKEGYTHRDILPLLNTSEDLYYGKLLKMADPHTYTIIDYLETKAEKDTTHVFKNYVKNLYDLLGNNDAKELCNDLYGQFQKNKKEISHSKYTKSKDEAFHYIYKHNGDCYINEVYKDIYEAVIYKRENIIDNLNSLGLWIIQSAQCRMFNRINAIGINYDDILSIKTDEVIFKENADKIIQKSISDNIESMISTERGGIKYSQCEGKRAKNSTIKTRPTIKYLPDEEPEYNYIYPENEYDTKSIIHLILKAWEDGDIIIDAPAGTGKTTLLTALTAYLRNIDKKNVGCLGNDLNKNVVSCLAFTNNASSLLDEHGMTLHSFFGVSIDNEYNGFKQKVDYIVIDEGSMVPYEMEGYILKYKNKYPNVKVIKVGDYHQLPPVMNSGFKCLLELPIQKHLCPNRLVLKINKRAGGAEFQEMVNSIINTGKLPNNLPRVSLADDYIKNVNLCKSNILRKHLNNKKQNEYKQSTTQRFINSIDPTEIVDVDIGRKLICRKARGITHEDGKKTKIHNGENFIITDIINKNLESKDGKEYSALCIYGSTIHPNRPEKKGYIKFRNDDKLHDKITETFQASYAMTIHKAQGQTITDPFTIWEQDKFTSYKFGYTAFTRATKISDVSLGYIDDETRCKIWGGDDRDEKLTPEEYIA
jgi:hypothetical protein